ncbi:sugar-binding protein [Paenibacillus guangzhouensis]|uniref:sugar-binding protein n=1 Tax=Paenibacillus guangzhouensis TaxID=1473112 RepID=UPI001266929D|nr:sugar-binding protein [Paenibacillus guangzhouensis]
MNRVKQILATSTMFILLFSFIFITFQSKTPESATYADDNTPELTVGDFENTDESWDFLIGSAGALGNGEFSLDSVNAHSGSSSGKLQLDFSSKSSYMNSYVSLEKYLFKRVLPTNALELSFWVKTADMAKFDLILVDNSNQNHQQTILLDQTTEWQKVTVSSFTSGINYTKWGGSNDGVWHGPLKKMYFKLTKASMKSGRTMGAMWIDDIRAKVESADLAIAQVQVGNVFAGNMAAAFDILTTGDAIHWSTENAWKEPISSGTVPVTASKVRLNLPTHAEGYYRLKIDAYQAGTLVKTIETTFAMLPAFDLSSVTESPFGIQTHYGINWNKESIPLLKYAGTKNVRDSFYWSEIEVNQGQYTFNPKFTLPMQSFKAFNIEPFLTFAFSNKYYDEGKTPYTEQAHTAYASYVKAMLGKFGSQLKSVEIWNEFNLPYFGGNGPAASRADVYFNLLKKGYEAVKSIRPDLNVVGGATAGIPEDWLKEVFELGGLDHMDSLSVHPYRYPETPEGLIDEIDRLNQLVRDHHNGESIPLWFSEIGWPTHLNPTGVDENTQAAYLIRSYVLSIAAGVEKIFWYNLMDSGTDKLNNEHNFGIVHNTGDSLGSYTPKPAYVALATLTRQLTGANAVSQDVTNGLYHYVFAKNNDSIHVLWSLNKKDVTLHTQVPLTVTDMMGRKITYTPVEGKVYLTLTGEPLFAQGDIDSIVQASPFSLTSTPAYTNDPVTVTLHVNELRQEQPLTAEVNFQGITKEIFIQATGAFNVQFPGVQQVGSKIATGTVRSTNGVFAGLMDTVQIRQAEQISSKHVVKNGADVLEVSIKNDRPTKRRISQIDWSIGSSVGSDVYHAVIPGNKVKTIDFPLSGMTEGILQPYQFKVNMDDGAVLRSEGSVKLVPSESRVPLVFRTVHSLDDLQDVAGIDLISDVHSRIGSHNGPEDFSGTVWATYDNDYLYMTASVHDDVYSQTKQGEEIWQGDSIQFAVSAGMPGESLQWYEYGMALTSQGPELYRWMAPQGVVTGSIPSPNLQITRDEAAKNTIYQLALPWGQLAPIVPSDGILSLSIVVNENDGNGRKGYVEWGSGIGASKQSSLFKPIELQRADIVDPKCKVKTRCQE